MEDSENDEEFVDYFNSIISASSTHEVVDNEEIDFQKRKHMSLCYKSNKGTMNISESEGHGCRELIGGKIEVPKYRHNFPKFAVQETTILRKYSEMEIMDVTKMKKSMAQK